MTTKQNILYILQIKIVTVISCIVRDNVIFFTKKKLNPNKTNHKLKIMRKFYRNENEIFFSDLNRVNMSLYFQTNVRFVLFKGPIDTDG